VANIAPWLIPTYRLPRSGTHWQVSQRTTILSYQHISRHITLLTAYSLSVVQIRSPSMI
jgi:hypothetical protein